MAPPIAVYCRSTKPGEAPNCAEVGVVGVLPGIIGCLQATEVIKLITGWGTAFWKITLFDALSTQSQTVQFERVPAQADVRQLETIEASTSCQVIAPDVIDIQPLELKDQLEDYQLLDVREDWERAIGALPGAHLPLGTLLKGSVDSQVLGFGWSASNCVYCQSGKRSLRAIEQLAQEARGLDWVNLAGGLNAWNRVSC